jgi:hypothetical protein
VDLQEAMEHLGYELWMLAETSGRIPAAKRDADVVANNAYLESMLFHARSLADFFVHNKKGFPSDIRRTEFGSVDWQPGPADAVARIESNSPVIDKHLAHLTWERVSNEPPEWRYAEVAADLVAVAGDWSEHLATQVPALYPIFMEHLVKARRALSAGP